MLNLYSLRSGSSGNCVLVFTEKTKILVDCGISGVAAEKALRGIGIGAEELSGIVITHEHSDHTLGVGVMCRRYNLPVYANRLTWQALLGQLGRIDEKCVRYIDSGDFEIGDVGVKTFPIPHDAAAPMGYSFVCGGKKMSVATDMGRLSDEVVRAVAGSDVVLLESNHDVNMLDVSRYPYYLKRRIKSDVGHLSNDMAGEMAAMLVRSGTRQIVLGHLSGENNHPELAYETVKCSLSENGMTVNKDLLLSVAERHAASQVYR